MSRARRRAPGQSYVLYAAGEELRPVGRCSLKRGEGMIAQGKAVTVVDEHGNLLGYQVRTADPVNGNATLTAVGMISAREMELVAGQAFKHGRSRTAGMSEAERVSRQSMTGRPLPAEDAVERAVAKVAYFAPRRLAAS